REDLHGPGPADQPVLAEQFRRDVGARLEPLGDRVEVDHVVFDAEVIVEPALGHATVQRHLAAFEPALVLEARARLCALVAAPRGLAVARALAAPDALLRVLGAFWWTQIAEIHVRFSVNFQRPTPNSQVDLLGRWELAYWELVAHFHQVPNLQDHPARGRRVRKLYRVVQPP